MNSVSFYKCENAGCCCQWAAASQWLDDQSVVPTVIAQSDATCPACHDDGILDSWSKRGVKPKKKIEPGNPLIIVEPITQRSVPAKKTLLLYQEVPQQDDFKPKFLELEGDFSHLNGIYINFDYSPDDKKKAAELYKLIYDDEGRYKVTFLDQPTKDWDFFAHCGFGL